MNEAIRKLWRVLDGALSWAEMIVVLTLLSATLLISFSQIVARWMGGGWVWADELVRYMVFWLGIFGAGPATRHHKHIAIDAFQQLLPVTPRLWIRRGTDMLAGILCVLFFIAIREYIGFIGDERSATLGVTVGTLTWPVAVAFVWIAIRFFADALLGATVDPEDGQPGLPVIPDEEFEESLGEEPVR
ncbi:MAG: TRAP transporter small permease subunit [Candidatus Dadabacteria bacterium]|nr:MAG: TRAP transporter small permease subunit [Candidatus Dadabacteria bacterium]